jgi:hypothetical protein
MFFMELGLGWAQHFTWLKRTDITLAGYWRFTKRLRLTGLHRPTVDQSITKQFIFRSPDTKKMIVCHDQPHTAQYAFGY